MAAFTPPPGFTDVLSDCEEAPSREGRYHDLELSFGTFKARKPLANAVGALGSAVNSKISPEEQNAYVGLFVRNHLHPDSFDDLIHGMMTGRYPPEAVMEVNRAIATWGTARPTRRS